ncbi:MAG TPA: fibronectin type III domain-containing protein, partial [Candidatus Saccharimonadia bacterium]|nr:fibronectin type III domain-containing protein [Candidatus Saccharimonadia bacterium]
MSTTTKSKFCTLVIGTLLAAMLPGVVVSAGTSCTVSISPNAATPAVNTTFTVNITNTGSTDLQWVDITVPTAGFFYAGNYVYDWAGSEHGDGVTFTNNTLAQGSSNGFQIASTAEPRPTSTNTWQIQASDDPGGAGAVTCTGSSNVAVSGHPPNDSNNGVSNIMVSSVTPASATVTWDSDNAISSLVYYGQTSDYGAASTYDSSLTNNHSVTLTGLSAFTGYHFQVAGSDGQGTFGYSGDSTFVTAAAPAGSNPPSGGSSGANVPGAHLKAAPTETIPPTISLTTDLGHPFSAAPTIAGLASDNDGVAAIDYSTDGGINWQPVTSITQPNRRKAHDLAFTFTPIFPDDGNYTVQARATDTSSNIAVTPPVTIIIDRLPPQTGPLVFAYGPQPLQPGQTGALNLVAGSDYRVTTSAVGGPTSLALDARPLSGAPGATSTNPTPTATFALTQNAGTGLWSGAVGFKTGGTYQLVARG